MINADKYKKNKFRKLIPTSSSQTDKLQKLTTIDNDKQPVRPQLAISQQISKGTSKVGVDGVSERFKGKHFGFERRLRTISSMNEKHEQPMKCASAVGQYKFEPQKPHSKEESKYNILKAMIENFKKKAEEISSSNNLQQLNSIEYHTQIQVEQEEDIEEKFDDLIEKTKLSSIKLIEIYVNRIVSSVKRQPFTAIKELPTPCSQQPQKIINQSAEKQKEYVESRPNNCRANLLNVSKFFGST